jgi:hypothetical protein
MSNQCRNCRSDDFFVQDFEPIGSTGRILCRAFCHCCGETFAFEIDEDEKGEYL